MPRLLRQLIRLLNRREKWQVAFLLVATVIQAGVELVGVASIAPFMSVVADPDIVQRNDILQRLYVLGEFESTTSFLTALGIGAIFLLALSNSVSGATQWATLRFVWDTHHRLAIRMMEGYLAQPYGYFAQRNSAHIHKNILSEVSSAIKGVLQPTMTFIARTLVTIALVGLLIVVDPMLAGIVVLVLGGAYGAIYLIIRKKQIRLGRERVNANLDRYKVASEAFGGIKDAKVLQREQSFVKQFAPASLKYSRAVASNAAISIVPRYLLETIAFGGILLIVVFYLQAGAGLSRIIPTLSLYAFAGYRLMPALQTIFAAAASIRFQRAALDDLLEDLDGFAPSPIVTARHEALKLQDEIRFERVTFSYPDTPRPALQELSLTIARNSTIGVVGTSGSGKTTLVDLLLGLYMPQSGRIRVDETILDAQSVFRWRKQVGYVPQHIFLCDDTISRNIAFGVTDSDIDHARVDQVAKIANLHDFIQTLPAGYDTLVGERGVRISGGQRQRIGIARALYQDPEVLVMDEATSSLDGATENAVMDAIRRLSGHKTIIIIAHRLTTVEDCDIIFMVEEGSLVDCGTYSDLIEQSAPFRAMAKLQVSATM